MATIFENLITLKFIMRFTLKKELLQKLIIQTNLWKTHKQNANFQNTKIKNSLLITQNPLLKKEKTED